MAVACIQVYDRLKRRKRMLERSAWPQTKPNNQIDPRGAVAGILSRNHTLRHEFCAYRPAFARLTTPWQSRSNVRKH